MKTDREIVLEKYPDALAKQNIAGRWHGHWWIAVKDELSPNSQFQSSEEAAWSEAATRIRNDKIADAMLDNLKASVATRIRKEGNQ